MAERGKLTPEIVRFRLRAISDQQKDLEKRRRDTIARCPHVWRYNPDPSGNRDSWHDCEICGKHKERGDA